MEGRDRGLIQGTTRHLPGETEENCENLSSRISCLWAEIWTVNLPNTKQECWLLIDVETQRQ
jgi:hypothetical protein